MITKVNNQDTFLTWKDKTNFISAKLGDISALGGDNDVFAISFDVEFPSSISVNDTIKGAYTDTQATVIEIDSTNEILYARVTSGPGFIDRLFPKTRIFFDEASPSGGIPLGSVIEFNGNDIGFVFGSSDGDSGNNIKLDVVAVLNENVGLKKSDELIIDGETYTVSSIIKNDSTDTPGEPLLENPDSLFSIARNNVEAFLKSLKRGFIQLDNANIINELNVTGNTDLQGTLDVTGKTTINN